MFRRFNTWLHQLFCSHQCAIYKTSKHKMWLECMDCEWTSNGIAVGKEAN